MKLSICVIALLFSTAIFSQEQTTFQLENKHFEKQIVDVYKDYQFTYNGEDFLNYLNNYLVGVLITDELKTDMTAKLNQVFKNKNIFNADEDVPHPYESLFGVVLHNYLIENLDKGLINVYRIVDDEVVVVDEITASTEQYAGDFNGDRVSTMNTTKTTYTAADGQEVYTYSMTLENK